MILVVVTIDQNDHLLSEIMLSTDVLLSVSVTMSQNDDQHGCAVILILINVDEDKWYGEQSSFLY